MELFGRRYWLSLWRVTRPYLQSDVRRKAYRLLAVLIGLLLVLSGLNVAISYVGRDFMTAIANRQSNRIALFAGIYLGVFAISTVAGGFQRYVQLLLGLRWREWLSRYFFHRYLAGRAYHRINALKEMDNPDERIANDINIFTDMTLSFLVMATSSVITLVSFIGVLWTISFWLVLAAFAYPVIGTALIIWTGRRLIRLNHLQLKKEADFRFALVHVRHDAEAIALEQAERHEKPLLDRRLRALVKNREFIIHILRNLMFVHGGYNYLDQLIPVLIVAPLFVAGKVEFGVITQAAMAFSQIFNAFSIIAEQYQNLAEYAAVVGRVSSLDESIIAATEPSGGASGSHAPGTEA